MFSFGYNSYEFYLDLLALTLVLAPVFYTLKSEFLRRLALTLGGIYLMYFIAPRLVVFYLLFWVFVYALQRLIAYLEDKGGGSGLMIPWCAFGAVLAPMVTWKIMGESFNYDFNVILNSFLKPLSTALWEIDMSKNLLVPLGLSFATFRALDLLIKTMLGKVGALSFDRVMFYGFFAPVQIIGPIMEYEEVARQDQKADPQKIQEGLFRITVGFIKVFALAGLLEGTGARISSPEAIDTGTAWLTLVGYSWYFYFNFSGYSDIAVGSARLYGFELKENFSFPFFRQNIQEYWNSWHMSLSRWAQRNIFVPAGGYRAQTQYFALFVTMMAIALWHDISLTMLLFGLWHGAGLVLHRIYAERMKGSSPSTARRIFYTAATYLFVIFSFPIVAADITTVMPFYKILLGLP